MSANNTTGGTTPKPPTYLSKDEKAEWRKVVASQAEGYFNDGHVQLLHSYAAAAVMLKRSAALLEAEGYTSEGSQGQLIQHPAVRMQAEAIKLLNTLSARLAIDPASQRSASISANGPGPNAQKGAFMGGLIE